MTGVEVRNCDEVGHLELVDDGADLAAVLVADDDLGLVAAGGELEVAHHREPVLAEPLLRGGHEVHLDLLVVAEELTRLAVGDHDEEVEGVLEAAVLLQVGELGDVHVRRHQRAGLAEQRLVEDVGGGADGHALLLVRRVQRGLDGGIERTPASW